jgi:predicted cation transporter
MTDTLMLVGLLAILVAVFALPFVLKPVERQLEVFLFVMGLLAMTIAARWGVENLVKVFIDPLVITIDVLVAGLAFKLLRHRIRNGLERVKNRLGLKRYLLLIVLVLAFISSIITAIIASLILVEVVSQLRLTRNDRIKFTIITCSAIGMGAPLTPVGEPLSTIAYAIIQQAPLYGTFWSLFTHLGPFLVPCIFFLAILSTRIIKHEESESLPGVVPSSEHYKEIAERTGKVYIFILALEFLGAGFKVLIGKVIVTVPYYTLYWLNLVSAVLDNATLTATEIVSTMSAAQITSAILALVIAGGMLIPGNIPNIIAANKLEIKSKEWARFAVPLVLAMMVACFVAVMILF